MTPPPEPRTKAIRVRVLDLMDHENYCDWATIGECGCQSGQLLIDLIAGERAEAAGAPLREALERLVEWFDAREAGRPVTDYGPGAALFAEARAALTATPAPLDEERRMIESLSDALGDVIEHAPTVGRSRLFEAAKANAWPLWRRARNYLRDTARAAATEDGDAL